HLRRRDRARSHVEIGRRGRGRTSSAACGMSGGDKTELACRSRVEQPCGKPALVDENCGAVRHAFTVERLGAQAALAVGIIHDGNSRREHVLTHLVLEEADAAGDGRTGYRAGEVTEQRTGDARIVEYGHG